MFVTLSVYAELTYIQINPAPLSAEYWHITDCATSWYAALRHVQKVTTAIMMHLI